MTTDLPPVELTDIGAAIRDWLFPQMSREQQADPLHQARLLLQAADAELKELRRRLAGGTAQLASSVPREEHDQMIEAHRRQIRTLERRLEAATTTRPPANTRRTR